MDEIYSLLEINNEKLNLTVENVKNFPLTNIPPRKKQKTKKSLKAIKFSSKILFVDLSEMNELWTAYFKQILEQPDHLMQIFKADYHGALFTLDNGTQGIVIHETLYTFVIVTSKDKVKRITKKGNSFCFHVGNRSFKLFGDQFCYRPADRSTKKIKVTPKL